MNIIEQIFASKEQKLTNEKAELSARLAKIRRIKSLEVENARLRQEIEEERNPVASKKKNGKKTYDV